MAYTAIDDPSAHFQVNAYSGASNPQTITNGGYSDLQPDLMWNKRRDAVASHYLFDSSRGVNSALFSDTTAVEDTASGYFASFNSDGFTTGSDSALAYSGRTYVAYQWKANGGTTSSNTSGTITSTVQANTAAGFSIVTYSGNGTNGATVGHGLGVQPEWVWVKRRNLNTSGGGANWCVKTTHIDDGNVLFSDTSDAQSNTSTPFNDTDPNTTTFTIGDNEATNAHVGGHGFTGTYVAYCFASIQGYSKVGSYIGNGNADGPFVYTGFKPAWLLIKNVESSTNWLLLDNKRDPFNDDTPIYLSPDENSADNTNSGAPIDFLSNGFKVRTSSSLRNPDGAVVVYVAFAHQPFVTSTGISVTAR